MPDAMSGRRALVTGGGTGIGAAVAEMLVRDGASVTICGRRRDPLRTLAETIGARYVVADVATPAEADKAVAYASDGEALHVLIANAGGHDLGTVGDIDLTEWNSGLRSNLTTAFNTIRAALPALIAAGDSAIVTVSSLAGMFAGPAVAAYTTAKHGVIGLTRSVARDYGNKGVRANIVCPGWVRTPMADVEMDAAAGVLRARDREHAYSIIVGDQPIPRPADPREAAAAICFLASPAASMITGASIPVDGGAHITDLGTIKLS